MNPGVLCPQHQVFKKDYNFTKDFIALNNHLILRLNNNVKWIFYFNLEHMSWFILNVWPLIIPRGAQLVSICTNLHRPPHSYTHTTLSSHLVFPPHLSGKQCEECSAGFYGNPRISGAPCRPCACNNNIDVTDPESCSRRTGECLKCLHNTQGPNCQLCKPGHFGSAHNQTCRSKSARSWGTMWQWSGSS